MDQAFLDNIRLRINQMVDEIVRIKTELEESQEELSISIKERLDLDNQLAEARTM